jgi:hypothetical protein
MTFTETRIHKYFESISIMANAILELWRASLMLATDPGAPSPYFQQFRMSIRFMTAGHRLACFAGRFSRAA